MSDFNEIRTPDMNEPWDGEGLPAGARAGLFAIIGVLVGAAIPYFVAPSFDPEDDTVIMIGGETILEMADVAKKVGAMRAWLPGDPLPFAHAFGGRRAEATAERAPALLATDFAIGSDGDPEVPAVPAIDVAPAEPAEPVVAVPDPKSPPAVPGEPTPATPAVLLCARCAEPNASFT